MREKQRVIGYYTIENSFYFGAALISALLFILFRLPFMAVTGMEGMGNLLLPLICYLAALLMNAFVLPAASSRMFAARLEKKHPADAERLLRTLMLYMTGGGLLMTLLFWFLGPFAAALVGIPMSGRALRLMGPVLWIMGYLGLLRGYYQGMGSSAFSQLSVFLEQLIAGIASLLLGAFFLNYGAKADLLYETSGYQAAYGAMGLVLSFLIGSLLALVLLHLLSALRGGVLQEANAGRRMENMDSLHRSLRKGFFPVLLAFLLLLCLPVLDILILGPRISGIYGEGTGTARVFGALSGLLSWGLLAALPACGLLAGAMGSVRNAAAQKNRRLLLHRVRILSRFAVLAAFFFCVTFPALRTALSNLFFSGEDNMLLRRMLLYSAPAALFVCFSLTNSGILYGLSHFGEPLKAAALSAAAHLVSLLVLMFVLKMEMLAVLFANLAGLGVFWLATALSLRGCLFFRREVKRFYLMPGLAAALCFVVLFLPERLCALVLPQAVYNGRLLSALMTVVFAALGFCVYFLFLIATRTVRRDELLEMPLGPLFFRLAAKSGLL